LPFTGSVPQGYLQRWVIGKR